MAQSMWEQTGDQLSDAARKTSRTASAVAEALEDGVSSARGSVRQGSEAAAELIDDTKKRVKRFPVEAVAITFAAGVAAGAAIVSFMRRK
jgi:ElaB/YqjD/DUF883 family membrane-anchored ribosome-binding protein